MFKALLALALFTESAHSAALRSAKTKSRKLSFAAIAGYQPGSDVVWHNNLDKDVKAIDDYVDAANLIAATAVYTDGAYSAPYATITLSAAIDGSTAAAKSAVVYQEASGVFTSIGYLKAAAETGDTSIEMYYEPQNAAGCFTGALLTADQETDGCMTAEDIKLTSTTSSALAIASVPTNAAKRNLQGFSTAANDKMAGQVYYNMYNAYYLAYQTDATLHGTYADQFILEALGDTTYDVNNKFDAMTGNDARAECIMKGIVYLSVWMYTVREMEDAIMDCTAGDVSDNEDGVHAWDEAVAFYTGSLEGTGSEGSSSGKMLFRLAEKRCGNYGTCSGIDGISGTSKVNVNIFAEFALGRDQVGRGDCVALIDTKDRAVKQMSIPLIQGMNRYAYKVSVLRGTGSEKSMAEGHTFAATILPRLAHCDASVAAMVKTNLDMYTKDEVTGGTAMAIGFAPFLAAVESTYPCMGISCADIGCLLDSSTGECYAEYPVCSDPVTEVTTTETVYVTNTETDKTTKEEMPTWAVGAIIAASILMLLACFYGVWAKGQMNAQAQAYADLEQKLHGSKA